MEQYSLLLDSDIRSPAQLVARWTDTIYLGYSGITNWEAFRELMLDCFEDRQLLVHVEHRDLSELNEFDLNVYYELLSEIETATPGKLRIIEIPHHS